MSGSRLLYRSRFIRIDRVRYTFKREFLEEDYLSDYHELINDFIVDSMMKDVKIVGRIRVLFYIFLHRLRSEGLWDNVGATHPDSFNLLACLQFIISNAFSADVCSISDFLIEGEHANYHLEIIRSVIIPMLGYHIYGVKYPADIDSLPCVIQYNKLRCSRRRSISISMGPDVCENDISVLKRCKISYKKHDGCINTLDGIIRKMSKKRVYRIPGLEISAYLSLIPLWGKVIPKLVYVDDEVDIYFKDCSEVYVCVYDFTSSEESRNNDIVDLYSNMKNILKNMCESDVYPLNLKDSNVMVSKVNNCLVYYELERVHFANHYMKDLRHYTDVWYLPVDVLKVPLSEKKELISSETLKNYLSWTLGMIVVDRCMVRIDMILQKYLHCFENGDEKTIFFTEIDFINALRLHVRQRFLEKVVCIVFDHVDRYCKRLVI